LGFKEGRAHQLDRFRNSLPHAEGAGFVADDFGSQGQAHIRVFAQHGEALIIHFNAAVEVSLAHQADAQIHPELGKLIAVSMLFGQVYSASKVFARFFPGPGHIADDAS